jgi:hypothetical protein
MSLLLILPSQLPQGSFPEMGLYYSMLSYITAQSLYTCENGEIEPDRKNLITFGMPFMAYPLSILVLNIIFPESTGSPQTH